MAVRNVTRDVVLATQLERADRVWARMRGLLGRASFAEGAALWITPCTGIHTIGMRFAIDAMFLDAEGVALAIYAELPPARMSRVVRKAAGVLELPAGVVARSGTQVGDRIALDG